MSEKLILILVQEVAGIEKSSLAQRGALLEGQDATNQSSITCCRNWRAETKYVFGPVDSQGTGISVSTTRTIGKQGASWNLMVDPDDPIVWAQRFLRDAVRHHQQ